MSDREDKSQPIEYRQLFARMYAVRVKHGKFFTDRAAEFLQRGHYENALSDLKIAQSFFPDNEKLPALLKMVNARLKKAGRGGVLVPMAEPPAPEIFAPHAPPQGLPFSNNLPAPPKTRPSTIFGQQQPRQQPAQPPAPAAPLAEPGKLPAFWLESDDD